MSLPCLDGRMFRDVTPHPAGDVGGDTSFAYQEDAEGTIWATYAGGGVRRGYLVGTRSGDQLDVRYVHVTIDATTAAGHCTSRLERLADGRMRINETWRASPARARASSKRRPLTVDDRRPAIPMVDPYWDTMPSSASRSST